MVSKVILELRRRDILLEKRQLQNNEEFLKGVNTLYNTILSENPELLASVDRRIIHHLEMQKKWKEKNKDKLKTYRHKMNFFYYDKKKCVDCGTVITNHATRCRACFRIYLIKKIGGINGKKRYESGQILSEEKNGSKGYQV
jgi:ribosomal protein L40E